MAEQSSESSPGPARLAPQQVAALLLGSLLLVFGITGFFVLGDPTAALTGHDTNNALLFFELNALQNIVHLVMGVVGLGCATALPRSRAYGVVLAVVGAALCVFGIVAVGNVAINFLSLNWADNILHGVIALIGLALAFTAAGTREGAVRERAR